MTSRERLLWAAFERIKARPEEWDQTDWRSNCGTVGCLAFHICATANELPEDEPIWEKACGLLGIPKDYWADGLFNWSDEFEKIRSRKAKIEWLRQHITTWLEKHGSDGKEVRAL